MKRSERKRVMGEEKIPSWTASKLCDSCKSAMASLYCRNDSAFLCIACDTKIHSVNKVASRHARVWMCEVCEQAPAHVTCKADAASLCVSCDLDIHSANPLARRHERLPVVPFYDSVVCSGVPNEFHHFFTTCDADWLNSKIEDADHISFQEVDPYLDLENGSKDLEEQNSSGADGVVPDQCKNNDARKPVGSGGCFIEPAKSFSYFGAAISHSETSSWQDIGVVSEGGTVMDALERQNSIVGVGETAAQAVPLFGAEREASVLRYREKRKNRKFEKTIRYASRKAYAEMRPRIKGRFAKRTENDAVDQLYDMNLPAIRNGEGFGVVPS